MKKIASLAAILGLLSGCQMYRLEELRNTTPQGTPFQNALAKFYMDFATEEEKEYDWFNSWHFADKGLQSAYGKDVAPEALEDWKLPKEQLPYLQAGREALLKALSPQNKELHPTMAAQAQFFFDCWVEQQEENWQWDDISYCRDGLVQALDQLGEPKPELTPEGAKPLLSPQAKPAAESISYMVFFAGNETVPTAAGSDVIAKAATEKDAAIIIRSAGGNASSLFTQRAETVKQRLEASGVKPGSIAIAGDGEAKEMNGKQVEIFINQ